MLYDFQDGANQDAATLADSLPIFRGLDRVPPGKPLFSDLETFLYNAKYQEEITREYYQRKRDA